MKIKSVLFLLAFLTSGFSYAEDCSHYFSVVRDSDGSIVSGATISVYTAGTVTPVSVFSDTACSAAKSNPFLTNAQGSYEFFTSPGLYKVVATKIGVGTFTQDYIPVGTQLHAASHASAGSDILSINDLGGDVNSSQIENGSIINDDISGTAAIVESKLALNFPTHTNFNDPSTDQKAALAGTAGLPSAANKYVTNSDPRNTNDRAPTAHATSHGSVGSDPITIGTTQLSGVNGGTDITADLEEESHASEHQNSGADEISVTGLSGVLADSQPVTVALNGVDVGARAKINLIEGTDIELTVADNPGDSRVDVTIDSVAGGGTSAPIEIYDGAVPIVTELSRVTFAAGDFAVTDGGSGNAQVSIVGDGYGTILDDGTPVSQQSDVNFIGPNIECVDNGGSARTDCTITGTVSIKEDDSGVEATTTTLDITEPDAEITSVSPAGEVNIDLSKYTLLTGRLGGQTIYGGTTDEDGVVIRSNPLQMLPELIFEVNDLGGGTFQYDAGLYGASSTSSGVSVRSISDGSFYPRVRVTGNVIFDYGSGHVPKGALNGLDGRLVVDGGYALGVWDIDDLADVSSLSCVNLDSDRWYQDKDCDMVKEAGENYLDEPAASVGDADYGDIEVSGSGSVWAIGLDVIKDTHIDWGSGVGQVDTDDITEGDNKFLVAIQKTDLTDGGDTGLHYHSSDRDLANATGSLSAASIGNGLTDAQVLNNLTISSAGSVDGASIKSGTIPLDRLGTVTTDFKAVIIPYPSDLSSGPGSPKTVGSIYFPVDVTILTIVGRVAGASQTCDINIKKDNTDALTVNLTVDLDGNSTSVIDSAAIDSGQWVGFVVDNCGALLTELTITLVYEMK